MNEAVTRFASSDLAAEAASRVMKNQALSGKCPSRGGAIDEQSGGVGDRHDRREACFCLGAATSTNPGRPHIRPIQTQYVLSTHPAKCCGAMQAEDASALFSNRPVVERDSTERASARKKESQRAQELL